MTPRGFLSSCAGGERSMSDRMSGLVELVMDLDELGRLGSSARRSKVSRSRRRTSCAFMRSVTS